jgi:polygalacturonase
MLTGVSRAQDSRIVVEPTIPPSCITLAAHLTSIKSGIYATLSDADEIKLDTKRIQAALDSCPEGRSVVLRRTAGTDAFLSGPLELRQGVSLVVDKGATLFASINPSLFEKAPGSCGIVNNEVGPGCNPFISVKHVKGAGIMGLGTIDGRGGIKLFGKELSAWEVGQRSLPGAKHLPRLIVADRADNSLFMESPCGTRQISTFHIARVMASPLGA